MKFFRWQYIIDFCFRTKMQQNFKPSLIFSLN